MPVCAYCHGEYPSDRLGWKSLYCRKCLVANLRQLELELAQLKKQLERPKDPPKE